MCRYARSWSSLGLLHIDAMKRGQSAAELAPESPAARELQELWRWVADQMGVVLEGTEQEAQVL